MSGLVEIKSTSEWQSLLSGTDVVIADFYADWCGPCKMIAPQFQRLAAQHSSPKKVAFAKVNVDSQQEVAQSNGVSAMPTFLIFHKGSCIETIKGANPSALSSAITKAVQLAGSKTSDNVFKTPGRTLGGQGLTPGRGRSFDTTGWLSVLTSFFGLYLVTLFSFDSLKAAELSWFNVNGKQQGQPWGFNSAGGSGSAAKSEPASQAKKRQGFKTLDDL